jgi:iron(III) transport system substrate-binding protein
MLRIDALALATALIVACGCERAPEVVVYTALDREFSDPIFEEFTRATGIRVRAKFDTEANKTVGLAHLIRTERNGPRCDLFWNNEVLHTLRLEREGLLAPYESPAAAPFPREYRSPKGNWFGFAARARVLLVNTERVPAADRPTSVMDLVDSRWQGQVGLAKPLFGTTATHAACLFAIWGTERAEAFFSQLHHHARVLSGNRQVAQAVAEGQLAFGLTDTDDAMLELDRGMPVVIVYPDQGSDQCGTLFIPNTMAIVRNAPNPSSAHRLLDYLLSAETETRLAGGPSAQIPLNPAVKPPRRIETPASVKAMSVDFEVAASQWDRASSFLREQFTVPTP